MGTPIPISEPDELRQSASASNFLMLITASNICHHLIAQRVISSESVVDGDFAVIDVSGRNRNFKVIRKFHPGYFVKQIQQWDAQTVAMLQCEAACYWLARNDSDFAPLATVMPEFHSYDLERHILITELMPESENLYEHLRRMGQFSLELAARLGQVLGTYHRELGNGLKDSQHAAIFPRQVPWILSADRRNSHPFKELSPATSELFDVVEQSSQLRQALDDLRTGWCATSLMHGDMRLENCIVVADGAHNEWNLKIVDWELADIGDPCWDLGSIIQAFLTASIMSLPLDTEGSAKMDTSANHAGAYSAIQSLWNSYIAERQIQEDGLLERCLKYGAARMIQSAYEYVQFSPQVSSKALYLLQVSAEILKDPRRFVNADFGMRIS